LEDLWDQKVWDCTWLMALVEFSAWLGFTRLKECPVLWVETSFLRLWLGKGSRCTMLQPGSGNRSTCLWICLPWLPTNQCR